MFVCCLFFQSFWLWPATHSVNCWHHLLFDGGDLNSHEFVRFSLHRRLWKSFPLSSLKRRINEFTWRSSESRRFFSVANNRLPQELEDFFQFRPRGGREIGQINGGNAATDEWLFETADRKEGSQLASTSHFSPAEHQLSIETAAANLVTVSSLPVLSRLLAVRRARNVR